MAFSSVIAGCHLKCLINGQVFGYVSGVPQLNVDSPYRQVQEIDSNITKELIPTQTTISGTLQVLRGRSTGGLEGAGMAASGRDALLQKYIDIQLVDRVTDEVVFWAIKCQITRQTWAITPKQLVVGQISFIGVEFANDAQS